MLDIGSLFILAVKRFKKNKEILIFGSFSLFLVGAANQVLKC
jgi:hypothetical protein